MKLRFHLLGVVAIAFAVGILFLREPGFGDDFTYWSFAFDLHERGLRAWQLNSFHDLRWPVWGVCWLVQSIAPGLPAYYGEPLLYLAAGAALSFAFGKMLTESVGAAWTCAIAFLFHPLLDTVCYRPMPDLSEGVWGAAAMLCWWAMMNARTRGRALLLAALTGASVYILESNRITGVFIIPVLGLATLVYFPRRIHWLVLAGVMAAVFYAGESFFYQQLFGDWMHNIHANLGNKGAKGTESIALWSMPFRFFDSLWKGSALAPIYCLAALAGIWRVVSWQTSSQVGGPSLRQSSGQATPLRFAQGDRGNRAQVLGRVIVLWFIVLYLEYACSPQGFQGGWTPLIRDADRFLCGLAVPISVLAAMGLRALLDIRSPRIDRLRDRLLQRPLLIGATAVGVLAALTSRELFNLGFVPQMRRYIATRPSGTKIFTHEPMRAMTFLVEPVAAHRFNWRAPNAILHRDPKLEELAAESDEFWYVRKLVWLTTRKKLEKKGVAEQEQLASYFDEPERNWVMTKLLAKGDTPDLIFHRRRTPGDAPPRVLGPASEEFDRLIPSLPVEWKASGASPPAKVRWKVPEPLRGQFARVELDAASEQVEALSIRMRFLGSGEKLKAEYLLKPYLQPDGGKEFFAFEIPTEALACDVQMRFSRNAKSVRFTGFRAILEEPPRE